MFIKNSLAWLVLTLLLSSCINGIYAEVTLEPNKLTLVQGESGTLQVSYTLVEPFTLATQAPTNLKLFLVNPPQGIQAEPLYLWSIESPQQMTISADKDAAIGTFTINVAQNSYFDSHPVPLELTVVAPN